MTTLREATRHLHHACEAHPLGQRMVRGEVTPQEWADWLTAFRTLHEVVDRLLPLHMHRAYPLLGDAEYLRWVHKVIGRLPEAARRTAALLAHETDLRGAAYVLHGAHMRGGAVMRPVISAANLPCAHTHYDRKQDAERLIDGWREAVDLTEQANIVFGCLLRCMGEITSDLTLA